MQSQPELPSGVVIRPLKMHADDRGVLAEIYRDEWTTGAVPVQWNAVRSEANVLRGVHVHPTHADYLAAIEGHMILGLHDIRRDSPTQGVSALVDLRGDDMHTAYVPQGVAHGFFFPVRTTYVYALSHYWSMDDEFGCPWNAPEMNLPWPAANPLLSARDANPHSYARMVEDYHAALAEKNVGTR